MSLLINKWHELLAMQKYDQKWHEDDLADELAEYHEETNLIRRWSELSDVVYTCTRGRWSGHSVKFPFGITSFIVGALYMFPKYTSRWLFFRSAGRKIDASKNLHEVRNPKKTAKLHKIAERNGLDKLAFQKVCEQQLKYWLLLP